MAKTAAGSGGGMRGRTKEQLEVVKKIVQPQQLKDSVSEST